jgi:hypothetical protein
MHSAEAQGKGDISILPDKGTFLLCLDKAVDELATKDAAEYDHGQEERVTRVDPALVIER